MAVWTLLVSFLAQKVISYCLERSKLSGTVKAARPREPWQALSGSTQRSITSARRREESL